MDETEFKKTYADFNDRPCAFSKAILSRCAGCSRAQKVLIAEREAMACLSPGGQARCKAFLDVLRHNALFALRIPFLEDKLPHGKELKVQCGGAQGLARSRGLESASDIDGLLREAVEHHGSLEALPYPVLVQAVGAYKLRQRGTGKKVK